MGNFLSSYRYSYTVLHSVVTSSGRPLTGRLPHRFYRLFSFLLLLVLISYIWHSNTTSQGPEEAAEDALTRVDTVKIEIPYPEAQLTPAYDLPPLFEAHQEYEDKLSRRNLQWNGVLTPAGDKYIHFANHAAGCGWGNVMQEMLFSTLVASGSGRGFVWDDYTWDHFTTYSKFNGKTVASHTPLSTMLSGYILGFPNTTQSPSPPTNASSVSPTTPYSISRKTYDQICPESSRYLVDPSHAKQHALKTGFIQEVKEYDLLSGEKLLDVWLSMLESDGVKQAKCVETRFNTMPVFDIWFFGNAARIVDIWPTLARSPALSSWAWSPLIINAFKKNMNHFIPSSLLPSSSSDSTSSFLSKLWNLIQPRPQTMSLQILLTNHTTPLPILALHVRRGDFKEHCKLLTEYNATYTGFNAFPEFAARDGWQVPEFDPEDVARKQKMFTQHCFPDIDQILRRVREVLKDYEVHIDARGKHGWPWNVFAKENASTLGSAKAGAATSKTARKEMRNRLRKVYIMTNGDAKWLAELKNALAVGDVDAEIQDSELDSSGFWPWPWEGLASSRDLKLGWEEKPVGQTLDMYVAQRAEVFVGNGFSSLTSNIVMLRKKNGFDPIQTRFW